MSIDHQRDAQISVPPARSSTRHLRTGSRDRDRDRVASLDLSSLYLDHLTTNTHITNSNSISHLYNSSDSNASDSNESKDDDDDHINERTSLLRNSTPVYRHSPSQLSRILQTSSLSSQSGSSSHIINGTNINNTFIAIAPSTPLSSTTSINVSTNPNGHQNNNLINNINNSTNNSNNMGLPTLPADLTSPSDSASSPNHGHVGPGHTTVAVTRSRGSSFSKTNTTPVISLGNVGISPAAHNNITNSTINIIQGNTLSPASTILAASALSVSFIHRFYTYLLHELQHHLFITIIIPILIILPIFLIWMDTYGKCSMSHNLAPLLLYTTSIFNDHNIEYWLDYGTLLGARRDGGIIAHEFDVDLSATIDQCDQILQLKSIFFNDRGYKMYGREDWVPEKASFIYQYGGYLHKPCVRIYDPLTNYYADVDWHIRLDSKYLPASIQSIDTESSANIASHSLYGSVYLPTGYQPSDGDIWCNEEGFSGGDPGGCRRDSDLFPLSTISLYNLPMKIPRHTDRLLHDMYGSSWPHPRPKGYKILFCNILPSRYWLYFISLLSFLSAPLLWWFSHNTSNIDRRMAAWRNRW